jgi:hypothetical protein
MKRTPLLAAVAFASVMISSCNQGTTGLPIPKDATVVVHINAASLTKKLTWKEIQETDWFKEMYKEENDSLHKKILDDPKNSGIDINSDFAFFMKSQGKGGYVVFEGNLSDADAFEKTLKQLHKEAEVKKDGDMNYAQTGGNDLISWNKSKFIFMADASMDNERYSYDSSQPASTSFGPDSLKKFTHELLALKSSNSIDKDDHFKTLIKEDGDIHFWMNVERYYATMGKSMRDNPLSAVMGTMNKFMKGNVATGTLRFDDGKITVKTRQYSGEETAKIMNKYTFKPVTEDLVNRIPSQNVIGAVVANYPPEAMKEFLKSSGMDGLVNMYLGKINYSLDELIQATKGQMVLAFSDFSRTAAPYTVPGTDYSYNSTKTDFQAMLAVSVNNKESFTKLLDIAKGQVKDSAQLNKLMSMVNYDVNNEWFVISNKPEAVHSFMTGGNYKQPFAAKISGHPFGMYLDIQKLMKGFESEAASMKGMFDASMKMWEDVVVTGGDYKDGVSTGEFTINMVDKKTNSLKQLNRYGQEMYAAQKKQREEMMNKYRMQDDSVVAPQVEPAK